MAPVYWWPFILIVFLLGILFGIYPLAAFTIMLAIVGGLAEWWRRRALQKVSYSRLPYYRRGFPGEQVTLRLEVENRKFLPVPWLRIEDPWPAAVGPEDASLLTPTHNPELGTLVNLFSLRWHERTRRTYTLLLRKRGVYALGPARLESGDMFGFFNQAGVQEQVDYLTVFPEPLPFKALRLPAEDPFGDRRSQRPVYEDPNLTVGVREYRPEDDFRRVHWPATAHTAELQVKVYQPVSARVLVACLNVTTLQYYWEGTLPELLEHLVRVAAAVVQHALEDGYRVGLISNGCLAHSDQPFRVPPGRSPGQLAQLMATLAGVTPLVTSSFDRFLMAEASRLPYGATLVMITGLLPPVLMRTILRLKQHGRRITVLYFGEKPPLPIPGVPVYHTPFTV